MLNVVGGVDWLPSAVVGAAANFKTGNDGGFQNISPIRDIEWRRLPYVDRIGMRGKEVFSQKICGETGRKCL